MSMHDAMVRLALARVDEVQGPAAVRAREAAREWFRGLPVDVQLAAVKAVHGASKGGQG